MMPGKTPSTPPSSQAGAAPGGGGKRHVHSHEHYDREAGIAVFTSPVVRPGRQFFYFDPIHELGVETQGRWADAEERAAIIQAARQAAGS